MLSFLFIAAFTYPFWGLALLFLFCKWATSKFGPDASSLRRVALVSPLAAAIFSPVVFGTDGFASITHWSVALIDPRHTGLYLPFFGFTLALAAIISLAVGRNVARKKPTKVQRGDA